MCWTRIVRSIGTRVVRSIGARVGAIRMPQTGRDPLRGASGARAESRLAACALLLEIAWADGVFTAKERELVEATVRAQFGLDACEARQLVDEAAEARRRGMPVWQFTRAAHAYTESQRRLLADFLRALADVDGAADTREAYALARISSLMRVEASPSRVAA